ACRRRSAPHHRDARQSPANRVSSQLLHAADSSTPRWDSHFWLSAFLLRRWDVLPSFTMNAPLQGRVALITGAAKRIGRAVALRLAGQGADVIIHYNRSQSEADDAVREIAKLGRKSIALQADLCNVAEIKRLFQQTAEHFGRLDILVNSAANFLHSPIEDVSE